MRIDVKLQYFDGCPNWRQAEQNLLVAAERLGLDLEIAYERIESPSQAEMMGFRGSPTILISGRDPFADPHAPVGLSCRVYRTQRGPSGSPSIDDLERTLRTTRPVPFETSHRAGHSKEHGA
jgi:hypothetical protein